MLVRRGLKGELPLIAAAKRLQDEVLSPSPQSGGDSDAPLADEARLVAAFPRCPWQGGNAGFLACVPMQC
jgi:hypothetical protein